MKCHECSNYNGNFCLIEKIYAAGWLRKCLYLEAGEPIITPDGSNFNPAVTERISLDSGAVRNIIDVVAILEPRTGLYFGRFTIGVDGKGIMGGVHDRNFSTAVWSAWKEVLRKLQEMNHPRLNPLIPAITARVAFDYSGVEYLVIAPRIRAAAVKQKPQKQKQQKVYIPREREGLADVKAGTVEESGQVSLFEI